MRKQEFLHTREMDTVTSSARICGECQKHGSTRGHLPQCRTCGQVGCCNSSPRRHPTEHFHFSGHPIIEGHDPPEGWGLHYLDERVVDLPGTMSQDGPVPKFV